MYKTTNSWSGTLLAATFCIFIAACEKSEAPKQAENNLESTGQETVKADSIYRNGRIYAVDAARSVAEAVAIKDGKFIYVGNNNEVAEFIGDKTVITDLHGKMAMPGLIDAHIHSVFAGIKNLYQCNFPFFFGLEQVIESIRGCTENKVSNGWITGGQWAGELFDNTESSPIEILDAISSDIPIALSDDTLHRLWVNSKALSLAGIGDDTRDPEGGRIVRDAETGKPTGILEERADEDLIAPVIPKWTEQNYISAINESANILSGFGVTGIKEAGINMDTLRGLSGFDKDQGLPYRVAAAWRVELPWSNKTEKDLQQLNDTAQYQTVHLDTHFVKIYLDGAPHTATVAMLDPYEGTDSRGYLYITPEKLQETLISLDSEGYTVKMHTGGDRSVRIALDAIEATREANGDSGLRHELAHVSFIHPDDYQRFKELGAVADHSPAAWFPMPWSPLFAKLFGEERTSRFFPIGAIAETGALQIAGTDWPSGVPTANPWPGIEAMATRQNPHGAVPGALASDQAIDLQKAIEIWTLNGAHALRKENVAGSIEEGKSADMIVLNQNIFEIPIEDVSETTVLLTLFEGKIVYQSEEE